MTTVMPSPTAAKTPKAVPSVSVSYVRNGRSTKANELGMRPMQERAYARRGEPYLLIKSPPVSGKSRALMFIALDKLHNQGLNQAIIVVPERSIGASFGDEPLSQFGFWADWSVAPRWNLCNAPGSDGGKVNGVKTFLDSDDRVLVCTHATFRFAVDRFGVDAFDDCLIAVDEFHHVSANPDNKLGLHLGQFIARDRVHIVAMTGSYFRGDAEPALTPQDEAKFDTVTYTYYEQLNGYEHLKRLDIGYVAAPVRIAGRRRNEAGDLLAVPRDGDAFAALVRPQDLCQTGPRLRNLNGAHGTCSMVCWAAKHMPCPPMVVKTFLSAQGRAQSAAARASVARKAWRGAGRQAWRGRRTPAGGRSGCLGRPAVPA